MKVTNIDIEWLQTFVIAAQEQNFRRAAERLHLAQPTVTVQIAKLEQLLGVTLFERIGRHVQLSAAGHRFLVHAKGLVHQHQESLEDMSRWLQSYQETIKIAVSPLVASTVLPRWMETFSEQYKDVEITIQVTESEDIINKLLSGESDIGFSREPVHHDYVRCSELYTDPVVLVAPGTIYAHDDVVPSVSELLDTFQVLTHNHPVYWDSLIFSLRNVYPMMRTMKVSQTHVTIRLIVEQLGISFLPLSVVKLDLLRGIVSEVPVTDVALPVTGTFMLQPIKEKEHVTKFAEHVYDYTSQRPFSSANW